MASGGGKKTVVPEANDSHPTTNGFTQSAATPAKPVDLPKNVAPEPLPEIEDDTAGKGMDNVSIGIAHRLFDAVDVRNHGKVSMGYVLNLLAEAG